MRSLSRWHAAAIHLGISAAVGAAVFAALYFVWYPPPLFRIAGGSHLVLILIGVDVVLGPLLTLVVFDPRKKRLALDLAIIAALQLGALGYGLSVMLAARPVYIVHDGPTFDVVAANALSGDALAAGAAEYRTPPLTGPRVVGATLPDDPAEREKLVFLALGGVDLPQLPKYYRPYAQTKQDAIRQARPLAELRAKQPGAAAEIDAAVRAAGRPEAGLRYLPLRARTGTGSVVIDGTTGDVVTMIAVDPF